MPAEWMFTLINRAIDEAYGVSASRQVDGASTAPKPITAARETEPPPPISPGLHKGGKEAPPVAPAPTPEKPKSADAIAELRERYIETLMEGVKAGNSDAMDRIEKIIGLK
jgi:hypothetical protein